MVTVLRALLLLGGIFYIGLGAGFLLDPASNGPDFGVIPDGAKGLSSIRGDFTAFFWVSGGCLIIGAWKRYGDMLLVTAALMGTVLLGRTVSLAVDGSYDGWWTPMLAEAITVILALIGSRVLPHHIMGDSEGLPG
ncbi:DUF4345 family protein [Altererythrobacter lutimaris]|uniref:DUF4345 family protein n=1 Tax=Altererythrobacter lutimaris TaxID=2743979 RepID=A0A850HIW2_9SPHN|nr:DUF4345 family protein [Altererythrobacter lutimaris]NVE95792.1 DUF4345 family protein [Altererythrobacter lutimaris]